jgi:hypothetical protein
MKIGSAVTKFLTTKWVLNVVSFLALFNVIGYGVMGNFNAVLYFIVIAFLVGYFSKNMTIVLGIPLILVNLFALKGNMLEGMDNNRSNSNNSSSSNQSNNSSSDQSNNNKPKLENAIKNKKNSQNKPDPKTGQNLSMSSINNNNSSDNNSSDNNSSDNAAQRTGSDKQGFEAGRRKNRGYDIDYATTIEDAYDELNNVLGSDGIQRLTSDTQGLMKQQMQLAEAMKGMGPILQNMGPMVENLKGMMGQMGGDDKEGLGNLFDLAKKFSGGKPPPS